MGAKTHLLLFGDASASSHLSLQGLYQSARGSAILRSYLGAASCSVCAAVAAAASTASGYVPASTLLDLSAEHEGKGRKSTAVTFALTTATQLGWLILQLERGPVPLQDGTSERALLGFCTGMLAALAAAYAPTLHALLELAPPMIRVSFEVGLALSKRSALVEATEESWARVVQGVDEAHVRDALDVFHAEKIPMHRQAFISAVLPTTITVTAPPSTLDALFRESSYLANARGPMIPSAQALHCPHLGLPPLHHIWRQCSWLDKKLPAQTWIISPSSGTCLAIEKTLAEMLHQVLIEIFQCPIHWPAVQEKLAALRGRSDVTLSVISTTYAAKLLTNVLRPSVTHSVADDYLKGRCPQSAQSADHNDIAVVGMAVRLPGANDVDELWDILVKGRDMHKRVPPKRFDIEQHYDPSGKSKNSTRSPFGCFIDDVDLFDAFLFHMSPREAAQTDPSHRLLLLTAYEALNMSGYQRDRTASSHHSRIGTFFGQTSDDYREANMSQQIDGAFYVTGGNRAFGTGRLNYFFGWEGPSCSVDTACSSSFASLQLACRALQAGDCATALAGGANIMTSPAWFAGLSRGGFLSPTGGCKTFDESADGYCRADGIGTVVLKRLGDALADNDKILGVIKAIGTNHSAAASSITQPHAGTQAQLFGEVLRKACVFPDEVDYVVAHGTGTQSGDVHEPAALLSVFGEQRTRPLYIGSIKPNIGHSEASSGVSSLITALLVLQKDVIPPHIGIKKGLNPNMPDLASRKILIPRTPVPFPPESNVTRRRCILVNNFNATGGNTCLVLQERLNSRVRADDPRTSHVVVMSGKSSKALESNMERLARYLRANSTVRLSDVAYTTTARRIHHERRKAFAVRSVDELIQALDTELKSPPREGAVKRPRVVFAFTGQGANYIGMGNQLFVHFETFRSTITDLDTMCRTLGLPSFISIIADPSSGLVTQEPTVLPLALVALQLALADLWKSWGIEPDLVIGHSIGEYAALCVAGVISASDLFYLLGRRADLIQRHCAPETHQMLAIGLSAPIVQEAISRSKLYSCSIACYNSSTMTVVSGHAEDIESLQSTLSLAHSASLSILDVPFAYHSGQMNAIVLEYEAVARSISYSKPTIPFVSSLLGEVITEEGTINATYVARQTREPVNFLQASEACRPYLKGNLQPIWIELGPKLMCLPMLRATLNIAHDHCLPSMLPTEDIWTTVSTSLKKAVCRGVDVRWPEFHKPFEQALSLIDLPTYAFDLESHWIAHEGSWMLHNGSTSANSSATCGPFLDSIALQRVLRETSTDGKLMFQFESNIQEGPLRDMVAGHVVNGRSICPSGVFAEMALSAATYIWRRGNSEAAVPAIDVAKLNIEKPLILASPGSSQIVTIAASRQKGSTNVEIVIHASLNAQAVQIASCTAIYGNAKAWKSEWSKQAYLFQTRIERLTSVESPNKANRFLGRMVYKTFSNFVQYDQKYHGIRQASVDYELGEATATVSFQPDTDKGACIHSPYWIDNLAHLSGWILNSSYLTPDDVVYLSHGWQSMRIAEPLCVTSEYQAYVRMQAENDNGLMAGDVHIYSGGATVAVFSGIQFQAMKRPLVERLLSNASGSAPALRPTDTVNKDPGVSTQSEESAPSDSASSLICTPADTPDLRDQFRSLLARELSVPADEIQDDVPFADLGVDSLLSLSILDAVRLQLRLELSSSFFFDYPTFANVQQYLDENVDQAPASNGNPLVLTAACPEPVSASAPPPSTSLDTPSIPFPRPVVLHRRSRATSTAAPGSSLFLLPDGSGSAASLAALPFSAHALAVDVVAYDSPFLTCPERFDVPFTAAAQLYADAIALAQPTGPVLLGGWSIGGILAYETACQLAARGRAIAGLALIDAPYPGHVPPISMATLRLLEAVGAFDALKKARSSTSGGGTGIDSLFAHFAAGSRALGGYVPRPWRDAVGAAAPPPPCVTIVAAKGIGETVDAAHRETLERARDASDAAQCWIIEPRPEGVGGWDTLLGEQVRRRTVAADHFEIVRRPAAVELVAAVVEAVEGWV